MRGEGVLFVVPGPERALWGALGGTQGLRWARRGRGSHVGNYTPARVAQRWRFEDIEQGGWQASIPVCAIEWVAGGIAAMHACLAQTAAAGAAWQPGREASGCALPFEFRLLTSFNSSGSTAAVAPPRGYLRPSHRQHICEERVACAAASAATAAGAR